jgi:hypothetical protein
MIVSAPASTRGARASRGSRVWPHLGTGEASSWRAALRVFELSYGKPAETVEPDLDVVDPLHVAEMTCR